MSSHNVLERGAGPGVNVKVSRHTPGVLGSNSKNLWLIKQTLNYISIPKLLLLLLNEGAGTELKLFPPLLLFPL